MALANTAMFAPYKVATWKDIGDDFKDADRPWVNDYGGYMSIGYDSAKVPAPTTVADLLKPEYKGKVALNGNPTEAGAAFAGVQMASVANGGTVGDLTKGVDYFSQAQDAGNFRRSTPPPPPSSPGRPRSSSTGTTSTPAQTAKLPTWKVDGAQGGRRRRLLLPGVNADAPHPAAARLWQEYLYSDEGQNLWLMGGARPVRFSPMKAAGTLDTNAAAEALPPVEGTAVCRPRPTRSPARPTSPRTGPTPLADASRRRALGGRRPSGALLGVVPFFAYTTVFLLIPTLVVLVGAFLDGDGSFTLANVEALTAPVVRAGAAPVGRPLRGDRRRRRGARRPRVCREHGEGGAASPSASSPRCAGCSPSSAVWRWRSPSSHRSARPG